MGGGDGWVVDVRRKIVGYLRVEVEKVKRFLEFEPLELKIGLLCK